MSETHLFYFPPLPKVEKTEADKTRAVRTILDYLKYQDVCGQKVGHWHYWEEGEVTHHTSQFVKGYNSFVSSIYIRGQEKLTAAESLLL